MPINCHMISSFVATSWLSPCCETCGINGWFTAIYSPCFGCIGCLKRHLTSLTCTDVISFIDVCMNFTGFIVSGFRVSHRLRLPRFHTSITFAGSIDEDI